MNILQGVKDYLKSQEQSEVIEHMKSLSLDEQFYAWKNVIFKLRNLNEDQHAILNALFRNLFLETNNFEAYLGRSSDFNMLVCLTQLFRNFNQNRFPDLEATFFKKVLKSPNCQTVDRLIKLGEVDLVCSELEHGGKLTSQFLENLNQKEKLIKHILYHRVELWKQCGLSYDKAKMSALLLSVIMSPKIKEHSEKAIFEICLNYSPELINKELSLQWSAEDFIQNAAPKVQLYVTNLLIMFIENNFSDFSIHSGIEKRLMQSEVFSLKRKCGIMLWKCFVKSLNISQDLIEKMNEELNSISEQPSAIEVIPLKSDVSKNKKQAQTPSLEPQFDLLQHQPLEPLTKSLYDCILALRSSDKTRMTSALKHLPYLIRNRVDVQAQSQVLCDLLLKLPAFPTEEDETHRRDSLVALLIVETADMAAQILDRYYSEDCALGDRHLILSILQTTVEELSNNPQKYQALSFDKFDPLSNQQFTFRQITLTAKEEPKQKPLMLEQKSRRWGQTRRLHENLQIVSSYENRFHNLTQHIYFPLLVMAPIKHRLLLSREPLLMQNLLNTITKMLGCSQNDLHLIKLVEEALEFLDCFQKISDQNVLHARLKLLLKISVLLNKSLIFEYPLIVEKVVKQLELLGTCKDKYDNSIQHLIKLTINNFKELFSLELTT